MSLPAWPVRDLPRASRAIFPRLRLTLGILLTIAIVATALTRPASVAQATEPSDKWITTYRPLTWNMQGAGDIGSKWDIVGAMAAGAPTIGAHNVVALQEAGPAASLPKDAVYYDRYTSKIETLDETKRRTFYAINIYTWNFKSRLGTARLFLYFMKTDFTTQSRNNLAMVSDKLLKNPIFIDRQPQQASPSTLGLRPSFGLGLSSTNNTWDYFFTLHATARGDNASNEADNTLAAIDKSVPEGSQWAALGGYNRNPSSLTLPQKSTISRTYAATRQGGGEYDYMVSRTKRRLDGWSGHPLTVGSYASDHWPVAFHTFSSSRQFSPLRTREHPSQCLAAVRNNRASITSCKGSKTQTWVIAGDYVMNVAFGKQCLDVRGNATANDSEVWAYDCNGGENQKWKYQDDGTLINPASKKCLETVNSTANLVIRDCVPTKRGQQWILPTDKSGDRLKVNKDRTVSLTHISAGGNTGQVTNISGSVKSVETSIHSVAQPDLLDIFAIGTDGKLMEAIWDSTSHKLAVGWREFKTAKQHASVPISKLTDLSVTMDAEATYVSAVGGEKGKKKTLCITRIKRTKLTTEDWSSPWACSSTKGYRLTSVAVPKPSIEVSETNGADAAPGSDLYTFTYGNSEQATFRQKTTYSAAGNKLEISLEERSCRSSSHPRKIGKGDRQLGWNRRKSGS